MRFRILIVSFSILMATACGRQDSATTAAASPEPAVTATDAKAAARSSESVTCPQYFSELRHAVIGTLRGTDYVQMVSQVTPVAASTQTAVGSEGAAAEKVSAALCSFSGKKLRKARQQPMALAAQSGAPRALARNCADWIERVDNECFTPLIESGQALSATCVQMLYGVSGIPEDLDQRLGDSEYCAGF